MERRSRWLNRLVITSLSLVCLLVTYAEARRTGSLEVLGILDVDDIRSSTTIDIRPSGDIDDYFQLRTGVIVAGQPELGIMGGNNFYVTSDGSTQVGVQYAEDISNYFMTIWDKVNNLSQLRSTGLFRFHPQIDLDTYLELDRTTVPDVVTLAATGTDNPDLKITAAGGDIDFDDENLTTTGTSEAGTVTEGGNAIYNATEVPGGELGGTWASPTVDPTHSGSAHHTAVTPGGSNTQVQYNNSGAFGGISSFTWDGSNLLVTGTVKIQFFDLGIFIHSNADGELTIEADVKTTIGTAGDIELGDGTERKIFPNTTLKMNLGASDKVFNDAHIANLFHADYVSITTDETSLGSSAEFDIFADANYTGTLDYTSNVTARNITFTSSDGIFDVANAGIYEITCVYNLSFSSDEVELVIQVNQADVYRHDVFVHTAVDPHPRTVVIVKQLAAGDDVEFLIKDVAADGADSFKAEDGTSASIVKIAGV